MSGFRSVDFLNPWKSSPAIHLEASSSIATMECARFERLRFSAQKAFPLHFQ
jgi:hypothetical protein